MDANARELGVRIRVFRQLVRHSFVDRGVSAVAATSLSDIVCDFHAAGCCIETTSDPNKATDRDRTRTIAEAAVEAGHKTQSPLS